MDPAINNAVDAGAKTIYLPLNWLLLNRAKELKISGLQVYPSFKIKNPYQLIFTIGKYFINSIISTSKQNSNYTAAISAVKNAYLNGSVVVAKALEYDGFGIGFPANLASDHLVLTVGAANLSGESYQYSSIPESDAISYADNDINLIAPGVDLLTTLDGNQEYGKVSGTGASAALATGIISLLQAAEGDLTPDDIAHILETTAAPVGGPGYDNQSGYGIIDAGAAMNYVATHDIKHGTLTYGQVEEISTGEAMVLYPNIWSELNSGIYVANKYKVTYTIPVVPSANNDLWYNAKGTYGWSGTTESNDQNKHGHVELFNDHAEVTTFIYKLYDRYGRDVGWHPVSPENIQLSYSYVGEISPKPLSVTISGPDYADEGETQSFGSIVQNGGNSVGYQWYFRTHPNGGWYKDAGATGPNYTHLFDYPDGTTMYENQAVKIVINSAGETAFDIQSVRVIDCKNEKHGFRMMAPCRN